MGGRASQEIECAVPRRCAIGSWAPSHTVPPSGLLRIDGVSTASYPDYQPRALCPTRTSAISHDTFTLSSFPPPNLSCATTKLLHYTQTSSLPPSSINCAPSSNLRSQSLGIAATMYTKTAAVVALTLLASSAAAQLNDSSVDIGAIPISTKSTPPPHTQPTAIFSHFYLSALIIYKIHGAMLSTIPATRSVEPRPRTRVTM
jgi:hypothetical protein